MDNIRDGAAHLAAFSLPGRRLLAEAVPVLVEAGSEAQSSCEDADTDRRFQLGYETCNKLLDDLVIPTPD